MLRRPRTDVAVTNTRPRVAGRIVPTREENPNTPQIVARYAVVAVAFSAVTAALVAVRETVGLLNMGLVFLIMVVAATFLGDRWVGVFASVLGFGLLNFFLIPPYGTLAVNGLQNVLALFVFLGVSLLISWLIAGAQDQARQASRRAGDVSRLYELSRTIIGAQQLDEVLPAIAEKVIEVFEARACWILLPNEQQQLTVLARAPQDARNMSRDEMNLASMAFWQGREIGKGIATPTNDSGTPRDRMAFVPLRGAERTVGVLAVADKADGNPFVESEQIVLATFADQAAVAIERLYLLREAARSEVLARTDQLKSALMSAVSHDLRTPLASIVASVTSLLDPQIEWDEETKRDFLQGIYEEAQRLNRLVGNLLDMSRIEGGALHPEKHLYEIGEVVEAVAQRLEPRLKGHILTVEVAHDLPLMMFDFVQIDQVLTNLLENAINYTPPGTRLVVRAYLQGDAVQVEVQDDGPGVPEEHMSYLFDKFYQVSKDRGRRGTGLGLAISKGLVEAHNGRIWAENVRRGGLKVTFTLPVRAEATLADAREPSSAVRG